jgi:hypothetical protein
LAGGVTGAVASVAVGAVVASVAVTSVAVASVAVGASVVVTLVSVVDVTSVAVVSVVALTAVSVAVVSSVFVRSVQAMLPATRTATIASFEIVFIEYFSFRVLRIGPNPAGVLNVLC